MGDVRKKMGLREGRLEGTGGRNRRQGEGRKEGGMREREGTGRKGNGKGHRLRISLQHRFFFF